MNLEDCVLGVRHGMILDDIVKCNRATRDATKGRGLNGGMFLQGCAETLLTTTGLTDQQ